MFESMLTGLLFSLEFLSPFLKSAVIFISLRIDGNSDPINRIIKTAMKNIYENITFSLFILDGLSESWQAFDASKFRISFKISFSATHLKENWGSFCTCLLW